VVHDTDRLDNEVRDALRKILRVLDSASGIRLVRP
jgi:hypothetical protein